MYCKENSIYVFDLWELRGISSPNIPRIGPHQGGSAQHDFSLAMAGGSLIFQWNFQFSLSAITL
jgi:hypothetical protein